MRKTCFLITAMSASVSFASFANAQNAVVNGSFEGPTGAPPVGWTVSGTAADGYLPVAIAYGQSSGYPNGAQGEVVPQDNAVSQSPDAAGKNGVYFVSDAAINLTLSQVVYLTPGAHAIGFDSYDTFNGAVQKYDAELTATIAGVKLADFFASTITPGIWTNHSGEAYITQAGYYDVAFVFNADIFPAKDFIIDRAFVIDVGGTGGTPIGGPTPSSFNYWDGAGESNANNGTVDGGNGAWNATSTNWTTAAGTVNGAYSPNPTNAIFAGTPGTVTIDDSLGQIAVTGMTFNVSGYTIVGDPITLAGTAATFAVADGVGSPSDIATIASVLTGSAGLTKTGSGILVLGGVNTYTGPTNVSAGTLVGTATSFGAGPVTIAGAGTLTLDQPTDATFVNSISGTGNLIKAGGGTLTLPGDDSAFFGATSVIESALAVNGSLANSAVAIGSGASLAGTGTVGAVSASAGSTVAPGNGGTIGTLTVVGPYAQAPSSTYAVKLTSTGQNDLITVGGQATLNSGAALFVSKLDAPRYVLGERYTVMSATGGVSGTYAVSGDTAVSLFYNLVADYDANHVYLDVAQTQSFASVALTPNQFSVATAADTTTGSLHDAIGYLTSQTEARGAFDQLSGEIDATARAVAYEDSRFLREAVIDHLSHVTGKQLWFHGFGSWGRMTGNGNAADWQRKIGGVFVGADLIQSGDLRIGLLGGYSHSHLKVSALSSSANADDAHLGAYAGIDGPLTLDAGGSYTFRMLKTARSVAFTGFSDALHANYTLGIGQAFAEAGSKLHTGVATIEPFGQIAYVHLDSGQIDETGGPARLDIASKDSHLVFGTLGVNASANLSSSGGTTFALTGSAGWRSAFDKRKAFDTFSFATGSADFNVSAPPIAKNVAALEAGAEAKMASGMAVSVSYSGQIGDRLADHGIKANLSIPF